MCLERNEIRRFGLSDEKKTRGEERAFRQSTRNGRKKGGKKQATQNIIRYAFYVYLEPACPHHHGIWHCVGVLLFNLVHDI